MRLPGPENRQRLLTKLLADLKCQANLQDVVAASAGLSHADLEAVVKAAVRNALGRALEQSEAGVPPLIFEDFERAIRRVQVTSAAVV
jgi:SpoVK/Ycf46/Vps4 family AAA+-type ATPase